MHSNVYFFFFTQNTEVLYENRHPTDESWFVCNRGSLTCITVESEHYLTKQIGLQVAVLILIDSEEFGPNIHRLVYADSWEIFNPPIKNINL